MDKTLSQITPKMIDGLVSVNVGVPAGIATVVDVETTGVGEADRIIELAFLQFRFDEKFRILQEPVWFSQRCDPGIPISEATTMLTGISQRDVSGLSLNEAEIIGALDRSEIIIAHNAKFDRGYIERELKVPPKLWGCTMKDVDWLQFGFGGSLSLELLCMRFGYWYEAHGALADVAAVGALLMRTLTPGLSVLEALHSRAVAEEWLIEARGLPFGQKDLVKARGYRWDGDRKIWSTVVRHENLSAEVAWLRANTRCSPSTKMLSKVKRFTGAV